MQRTVPLILFVLLVGLLVVGRLGLLAAVGISASGQVALFILCMAAVLWISELLPLFVTSLLILALSLTWLQRTLVADGILVPSSSFTAPFFSDIILLFLGGFVLSAALQKHSIDELMARWVMQKTGGSIPRLMIGIMAITALLSMWLSNTATTAMMLSLCLPIIRRLSDRNAYRKAILLSVPFAANIGGLGTPIGTPPNAIAIQYLQRQGIAPSFVEWMALAIPVVIVMLIVAWLTLMLCFRGQAPAAGAMEAEPVEIDRSPELRTIIAVALLTIAGWLTTGIHHLSSGTVALLPVLVFFGGRMLGVDDLRRLSWDVLLTMGGGLCLGRVISVSGLADWLITRLPTEGAEVYMLIVAFGVVACFMSSVMSNTATANLVLPIVIGLTFEPISPVVLAVAFACSLAMPLPISTPPNAIAFSSGEIRSTDLMKPGLIITIIGLGLTFVLGYRWWIMLGLF